MARQKMLVNYHDLPRRELQILCKKHGIPANKTNVHMADALASLLKKNRQTCFVSATPSSCLDADERKCVLSNLKMQNERQNVITPNILSSNVEEKKIYLETELEGEEAMEEDTLAVVKDAHFDELAEGTAQGVRKMCDSTTDADEGHFAVPQVKSDASADCEELGPENAKIFSTKPSPCTETIESDSKEAKGYTGYKESPKHIESMVFLNQGGDVRVDASSGCASPKSKQEETTTDKELPDKVAENKDTMLIDLPAHHPDENGHADVSNSDKVVMDVITDSIDFASHDKLEKRFTVETENKKHHMDSDCRKVLLPEESFPAVVDRNVQGDGVFSQTPLHGRNERWRSSCTVNTASEPSEAEPSVKSPGSSFQFFVECDNGIKLFVDLKNDSPLDWMKTRNYEFSLPQDLHEHKLYEQTQWKSKIPTNNIVGDQKINSDRVGVERSPNRRPIVCPSNTFQRQKTGALDCLLGSSNETGFVATSFPWISRSNLGTRERRCTSVLIPPRGANRGLHPLISRNASRFSSPIISPCRLSSFSFTSSQSNVSQQINKSSDLLESCGPVTAGSKAGKDSFVQPEATGKESLSVKDQFDRKMSNAAEETGMMHDIEMVDQELCGASMKTEKNEPDKEQGVLSGEEVVIQSNEKDVQRTSQMHYSQEKSQKEMHWMSQMKNCQGEEPKTISRYRDDYKKSPFIKNLRSIKSLARASTMRADILARKRATPLVEKFSTHRDQISIVQSVNCLRESMEEYPGAHVSRLRDGGEIVNEHSDPVVTPRAYRERDLCFSDIRSEREPPVISPRVYRERDLCVSGLNMVKDSTENVGQPVSLSTHLGPGLLMIDSKRIAGEDAIKSSTQVSHSKQKLSGWHVAESAKGMHAQKIQQLDVNDGSSAQGKVSDKVLRNCVHVGYGNQNRKIESFLQELSLPNSSIFVSEPNFYNARFTERQKRHREHFKTSLTGKSREKAMKIAKQMALVQRSEILKSRRGVALTN